MKVSKIRALACTKDPECVLLPFERKHHFLSNGNAKSICRLHDSFVSAMLRLCKSMLKKNIAFCNMSFYDGKMHISTARGSQNGEKMPSVVGLPPPTHPPSQPASLPASLPASQPASQPASKMDPKWIQKQAKMEPNSSQPLKWTQNGSKSCPRNGWADHLSERASLLFLGQMLPLF